MIEIPGDAMSYELFSTSRIWERWRQAGAYSGLSPAFPDITYPQTYCWLLTHKSGAYVIWSAWTGKQPKKYPDIETAKIAVELQV